jgi:site-specific recombinase XerD
MWLPGLRTFPDPKPTVKQKLAAVRMLYDFLVVRQITPSNPAHSVRGPKYVVKKGKTPVWSREDAKTLLDSIPKDSVSGLRDLALIAAMFYSFARVSAVLKLKVDDYYHNGARRRLWADDFFMSTVIVPRHLVGICVRLCAWLHIYWILLIWPRRE